MSIQNLRTNFKGALVIINKTCKQARCPSVGEWINCDYPDDVLLSAKKE